MTKKQKWGIVVFFAPFILLALDLALWSLLGAIISAFGDDSLIVVSNWINVVLGFLGIISLMSLPVAWIVALILLVTGDKKSGSSNMPDSGSDKKIYQNTPDENK